MRKIISIVLVLVLVLTCFSACKPKVELEGNAKLVAEAANLTHEQLVEKAKAESGTLSVYANTSRAANAGKSFEAKYGIKVESTNLKDSEIYAKLETEISSGAKGADMVMIQDGAKLKTIMDTEDFLINYVPASVKGDMDPKDLVPLVQQYLSKLFIYNNLGDNVPNFTNVWQLTEAKHKGKIFFKSPESELANMNFLVMLTSPDWSKKLESAYESYFGKKLVLDKKYKNAGYMWIAQFIGNCSFAITSDTTMCETLSRDDSKENIGLFVFSKFRSKTVKAENLTVADYYAASKGTTVDPFAGFVYPMYTVITKNASRPYTSMLFIEYLLTAEGFEPWGKDVGAYSTNGKLDAVQEGDHPLSYWRDRLVIEDPSYINSVYSDVYDFISPLLG